MEYKPWFVPFSKIQTEVCTPNFKFLNMNIFYLHEQADIAAQYHCDKHCVKMIVEYCQLLSTAHRVNDGIYQELHKENGRKTKHWYLNDEREYYCYKATHIQHPCALWTRASSKNYLWLHTLLGYCLKEYTARYQKQHACTQLHQRLINLPHNIGNTDFIPPPQAMPEQYRVMNNTVLAYRQYYLAEKRAFAKWKLPNTTPDWYLQGLINN